MEDVDYTEIAGRYGVTEDSAKDLFDRWLDEEDATLGEASPEERFERFVSNSLGESPKEECAADAQPAESPSSCTMDMLQIHPAKERTKVSFVPAPTPAKDSPIQGFVESERSDDEGEHEAVFAQSALPDDDDAAEADAVYALPTEAEEQHDAVLDAAFDNIAAPIQSTIVKPIVSDAIEAKSAGGESWDALLAAANGTSPAPAPAAAAASAPTGDEAQDALRRLLICEAKRVSNELTPHDFVFVVIPNKTMAPKTFDRIKASKDEKHKFILSHILVQAGTQPGSQLLDRPYHSLEKIPTEYSWPSTGQRRFVRRGNIPFYLSDSEDAILGKYGKKVKPVYLAPDCDQVLG